MNIATVFTEKKENSLKLKKVLGLLLKYKPLWLIKLSDANLTKELIEWLKSLPAGIVVYSKWAETQRLSSNLVITWETHNQMITGYDFIVCDDEICNLNLYIEKWIIPIILRNNYMAAILKEFNPLRGEWNAFFYEELDKWSIFYTIVRYLENYKFPQDNKNLVKNILKI